MSQKISLTIVAVAFISLGVASILTSCKSAEKDSVTKAEIANKKTPGIISPEDSKFLVEMADARRMDFAEGELASKRGTTTDIRSYGQKMMQDQMILLQEIQTIAHETHTVLPTKIGADKQDGLNDLSKLAGVPFDKKFLSMIQRDHERDVKQFQKVQASARLSADNEVVNFAKDRLPMIENHLMQVRDIKKDY